MPSDDASEGNERMSRHVAKRLAQIGTLALLRLFSVPALWLLCKWRRRSRAYRDSRLLATWSDAMLRDVGLRREEVDRSFRNR